jgi:YHS domain-containing protein
MRIQIRELIMLKTILRTMVAFGAIVLSMTLSLTPANARDADIYTGTFSSLALGGYDTVAYHTQGAPVKGQAAFETTWKGALWRFASAENMAKFKAAPDAYAPQFGGYCAWAVSQNYTASGDPLIWKIVNGKLYVNYDASVQKTWEKDIPGNIAKADKNWPGVLN